MTTNTRVRDLIAVTGQLITLMKRETDLLEAMQAEKIGEFQKEKGVLADRYVALVKELRGEPELMKAMEDAVRAELKELLEQFNATAKRNEKAIRVAREVNERIVKAIVDATQQQRAAVGPLLHRRRPGCGGHGPPQPRQAAVDGRRPQPLRPNPVGEYRYESQRRPQRSRQRPQGHAGRHRGDFEKYLEHRDAGLHAQAPAAGDPGHRRPGRRRVAGRGRAQCQRPDAARHPRQQYQDRPAGRAERLSRPAADPAGSAGRSQFSGQSRGQPQRRVSPAQRQPRRADGADDRDLARRAVRRRPQPAGRRRPGAAHRGRAGDRHDGREHQFRPRGDLRPQQADCQPPRGGRQHRRSRGQARRLHQQHLQEHRHQLLHARERRNLDDDPERPAAAGYRRSDAELQQRPAGRAPVLPTPARSMAS